MVIRGVDVSRHQAPAACDWPRAYDAGVRFAWVKGSEGQGGADAYVDPAAAQHLEQLGRTPIVRGMYHFARPDRRFAASPNGRANGTAEGEHAAATAVSLGVAGPGHLPVAIDLEKYTSGATTEQRDDFVRGLIDTLERELGRLPLMYTGQDFWAGQQSAALALELRERGVLLWQVDYRRGGVEPGEAIRGWPWSFWQWSGGGSVAYAPPIPGLPIPVDQNVYRGTLAELRGLAESGA